MKKAVLFVNVGTPDAPTRRKVARYLFAFLNDRLVIDLPWIVQKILVNLIIIPFRINKSTKLYKKLWTPEGSPLLTNAEKMLNKFQTHTQNKYEAFIAMRYGNPSIKKAIEAIEEKRIKELIVVPLYPQYSLSTTLTTEKKIRKIMENYKNINYRFTEQFYHLPSFINALAERVKEHNLNDYDHLLISFHGLPLRHIKKMHQQMDNSTCNCENSQDANEILNCYNNSCLHTAKLLVEQLGLTSDYYTICFQSRLTKNWLSPFTDTIILEQIKKGNKKLLVVSPSFVADCLETTVEISIDYKELFLEAGGEKLTLVTALNDSDAWIKSLTEIIEK